MKGYVAVQKKLLLIIYALWEKQENYDPNYHQNAAEPAKVLETDEKKTGRSINLPAQDAFQPNETLQNLKNKNSKKFENIT